MLVGGDPLEDANVLGQAGLEDQGNVFVFKLSHKFPGAVEALETVLEGAK